MVRNLNIALDEREFAAAMKKKGNRTWKEVLMDGLEKEVKQD